MTQGAAARRAIIASGAIFGGQAAALLVGTAEVTGLDARLATRDLANGGAVGLPAKEVLIIGV